MLVRLIVLSLLVLPMGCSCGGGSSAAADAGADAGPGNPDGGTLSCPSPDSPLESPAPRELTVTTSDAWAATLDASSAFWTGHSSDGGSPVLWAKWTVLLEDPDTVYFQDSQNIPFHYDFISEHVDPFIDITREELDAISLHEDGRKIALGAVLWPTLPGVQEYGIQIISEDPLHPALIADLFERVKAAVNTPERTPVYVPAAGQSQCAAIYSDWLGERGIRVVSSDKWLPGDQCYAHGWAVGRLVRLAASEVDQAALDGSLTAEDILLLEDPAPAELPPVAGILGLAPSSPNSHTAILAQSFGIPFAYLRQDTTREVAEDLVGQEVAIGSFALWGGCEVRIIDMSAVDPDLVAELRALAVPPQLTYPAKANPAEYVLSAENLGPGDIARVGGKAAHYGILRDTIPAQSRAAAALTFRVWNEFLTQTLPGGMTLQAFIDDALAGHSWPPAMAELDADLAAIRSAIENDSEFSPALRAAIEAGLVDFDPAVRLRFRSSTNVEDSATFTGAGLYDSYTGCLADDLDDDETGPSACDSGKANEAGSYRALRRVFASFYNRNAFLERLRRGVDESEVGMAVLVHRSFPDDTELANGVAVFERNFSDLLTLVTQVGAESVSNPTGDMRPETVEVYHYGFGSYPTLVESSSLLPLGGTVLDWEAEYVSLTETLAQVADVFGEDGPFALDFEYKKVEGEGLVIKQVRPMPVPDSTRDVTPLLVDTDNELCVFQGESSDVFAIHRLKSRWLLRTRDLWLEPGDLTTTFLRQVDGSFVDDEDVASLSSTPAQLPGFAHALTETQIRDSFTLGTASPRTTTFDFYRPEDRMRSELPVMLLGDLYTYLTADYDDPVVYLDWDGSVMTRTSETVELVRHCVDTYVPTTADSLVERSMIAGGVSIATQFYWPPGPTGASAGYTAPLMAWEGTTITGLTTTPITLTSAWSQSHRPHHHNFGGDYIFEPRLDPGVTPAQLAELETANIQMIFADESNRIFLIGFDGSVRAAD